TQLYLPFSPDDYMTSVKKISNCEQSPNVSLMQRMSDMLSRWFEEASEAQSSRGSRPQTRPRGTAIRPEGSSNTPAAPPAESNLESSAPETPVGTDSPEVPASPAATAEVPMSKSTSSSSSGSSSTVTAPPTSGSSSVESSAASTSPLTSSPDSEKRSQADTTGTPTPTATPTSEPALSGAAEAAGSPPEESATAASSSAATSSTSTARPSTAEPVLSLHYSSEGTTTSTIKLDFTDEWSSSASSSMGSGASKVSEAVAATSRETPSAETPCESSGQQSLPAASSESQRDVPGSSPLGSSASRGLAEWDYVVSPLQQRSQPEGSEDPSGGCRRAEPAGEEGVEGQSQPAPSNQESDDSDDDPILIPPARFRGQGQRWVLLSLLVRH
ncbi:hypothetical protein XENOCAPTIV_001962, partial [Xenoophorus captivus]